MRQQDTKTIRRKTRRGRSRSSREPWRAHQESKEEVEQVINISSIPLSTSHLAVLSEGLTFAPTNITRGFQTKVDLFKFHRNLQLKVWCHTNPSEAAFHSHPRPDTRPVFKPNSAFTTKVKILLWIPFTKQWHTKLTNSSKPRQKDTSTSQKKKLGPQASCPQKPGWHVSPLIWGACSLWLGSGTA